MPRLDDIETTKCAAQGEERRTDPGADGARRRRRPGRGPGCRRGRLPHQAVRAAGAARPAPRPAAPRRPDRRRRRPRRSPFADLTMDLATREVTPGGRSMELTRTEFTLLEMFLRRPRRVLERSFILEEVWGYDFPTTFFAPLFDERNTWHVYGPRGLDTSIDHTLAGQMQYTYFPVQLLDFARGHRVPRPRRGPVPDRRRHGHHAVPAPPGADARVPDRGRRRRRSCTPRTTSRARRGRPGASTGLDREDALHIGFAARRRPPRSTMRSTSRRSTPRRWGGVTARSSTRSTSRCAADVDGSRCTTTTRPAPTRGRRPRPSAARASATRSVPGEVFAAAEGSTITLRSDRRSDARRPGGDRDPSPALAELNRAIAIAVDRPRHRGRAARRGDGRGLRGGGVSRPRRGPGRHRAHEAHPDRRGRGHARAILDELAADAGEVIARSTRV